MQRDEIIFLYKLARSGVRDLFLRALASDGPGPLPI
jgi:hypothetical protein